MVCSNISIWPKKSKKQKQKFYQDMKGEKKNCLRTKGNGKRLKYVYVTMYINLAI